MVNIPLLTVAALVVATKALDCLSTLAVVRTPDAETNAFTRSLMRRMGVRRAVALVFALASAATCALAALAAALGTPGMLLYLFLGLITATVQAAVAHTNWTRQWNPITRQVLRLHLRLERFWRWLGGH